jgi:hypothetical protein
LPSTLIIPAKLNIQFYFFTGVFNKRSGKNSGNDCGDFSFLPNRFHTFIPVFEGFINLTSICHMRRFLDENFLLNSKAAQQLYHEFAKRNADYRLSQSPAAG